MNDQITIVCYGMPEEKTDLSKGFFTDNLGKNINKITSKIPANLVVDNLSSLIAVFSNCFNSIHTSNGSYELDEIELKVEISAEGQIALVGSIGAECTGGITLKFKKGKTNE